VHFHSDFANTYDVLKPDKLMPKSQTSELLIKEFASYLRGLLSYHLKIGTGPLAPWTEPRQTRETQFGEVQIGDMVNGEW
jgi:hypothetical protein